MIVLEILFGLMTSFALWLCVALIFSIRYYRKSGRRNSPLRKAAALWVLIAVLAVLNLLFIPVHITALFNAGPTSGTIIDAATGRLIPGATVILVWKSPGKPPIALPWWAYLLPSPSCSVSVKMMADAKGGYSAPWVGYKTWRGCIMTRLTVNARGYQPYHFPNFQERQSGGRAAAPFSSMLIKLVPEPDTDRR